MASQKAKRCHSCDLPDVPNLWKIQSDVLNCPPNQYNPALVPTAEAVVQEGQKKMLQLERAMLHLEFYHRRIETIVEKHLSYLSMTTRLPDEVLLHIFHYCQRQVWSLSSVCKRWRGIIIAASELWTHIRFRGFHHTGAAEGHCRRINLQLDRALTRPLAMEIDASGIGNPGSNPCSVKTIKRLVTTLHRCTSLQLTVDELRASPTKLVPKHAPLLPLLKSIRFVGNAFDSWAPTGVFKNATALTELSVHNAFIEEPVLPPIVWNNLETISLRQTEIPHSVLLDLLRQAPNVTRLTLQDVTADELDADTPSPDGPLIHLNKLQVMELDWALGDLVETIPLLRLPALLKLHVLANEHPDAHAISSFITTSAHAHNVTSFSIAWSPLDERFEEDWGPLIDLLKILPNLRQLGIGLPTGPLAHRGTSDVSPVLSALKRPSTSHEHRRSDSITPLCPQLTELQLHGLVLTPSTLKELINSRTTRGSADTLVGQDGASQSALRRLYLAKMDDSFKKLHMARLLQWLREASVNGLIEFSTCRGHWYDTEGPICPGCEVRDANPLDRQWDRFSELMEHENSLWEEEL